VRLLHITRDFPPLGKGGLSSAVFGLATALSEAGHRVEVLSADGFRPRKHRPMIVREERLGSLRVVRLEGHDLEACADALGARFEPDLIHVHHGTLWPLARALAAGRALPRVLSVHVLQRHQNRLRGFEGPTTSLAAQRRAVAEAERVVVSSQSALSQLAHDEPEHAGRLRLCPLGIEPRPLTRWQQRPLPEAPVVSVTRFDELKGTGELIEWIGRVGGQRPELRFMILGGVADNPRAEARWRRRFDALPDPLRARVELAGWVSADSVAAQLSQARLLVSASRYESFGLAVLEAMAHGLPIVATAAGGVAELLEHGQSGLLSPVGDPAALAQAALGLLGDDRRAQRLGLAARRRAREHYSWSRVLPALLGVYGQLLY